MLVNMFERCLYFNVNALARKVNRLWDDAFKEFDLSPSHAYLLRLVLAEPGMTAKQIAAELKLEKSTITRFLNVLEDRQLIQRKSSISGDAREQAIYPARAAKLLAHKLEATGELLYQEMLQGIGDKALKALVQNLRKTEQKLT